MGSKPVLKIGHLKITDHLILGVTKDKYERGIETFKYFDLQTVPLVGWNQVGNALRNSELDGAFILAPYAMNLFASKPDIRLVLLGHRTGSVIITSKRANIQKVEDFKGKTIILPLYLSVHTILMHKLLAEKGLSLGLGKDVMFEVDAPVNMPEIIEWDEGGTIGGFIVAEPFGTKAVLGGYGTEFCLSQEIWPNHPCCVLVMRNEVVEKMPDAVFELTQSLVKSGAFVSKFPEAAVPIAMQFLNQPEPVVRRVLLEPVGRVKTGELFPVLEDLERIQTYMAEHINIDTGSTHAMSTKVDMEKLVDPRFAQAAGAH